MLVGFINLWDPQAWGYAETVVLFAAVIIGGLGNHRGAILGAILVPVSFEEATRYIPPVPNNPNLIPALQWVVIGLLILVFLWFRPQGILPERRRKILGDRADAAPPAGSAGAPSPAPAAQSAPANGSITRPAVASSPTPAERADDSIVLSCEGLVRTFEGVHAVNDVTMSFQRGRLTGIIGPNGAGKSTALAMLAGTLEPTAGKIYYRGEDVTSLPAYRRARRGLVRTFQLASEFKRLTVIENLLTAIPGQQGESFRGAVLGRRYWGVQERKAIERSDRDPEGALRTVGPWPTATPGI